MSSQPDNPFASPMTRSEAPTVISGNHELADRGSRLGAALLDGLTVVAVYVPAGIMLFFEFKNNGGTPFSGLSATTMGAVVFAGIGILAIFIYNLLLINRNGQTIGKKFLGIKVLRTSGEPIGLGSVL